MVLQRKTTTKTFSRRLEPQLSVVMRGYGRKEVTMTRNQIEYQRNVETQRSNQAQEALKGRELEETQRSNKAREAENYRSNTAKEAENYRSNYARERETSRSNRAQEGLMYLRDQEVARSNLANEVLKHQANLENVRSNQAREAENYRHNTVSESETKRSNLEHEAETRSKNFLDRQNQKDIAEINRLGRTESAAITAGSAEKRQDKQLTYDYLKLGVDTLKSVPNIVDSFVKLGGKTK